MKTKTVVVVVLAVLMAVSSIPAVGLSARGRVVDMKGDPVPEIKVYALLLCFSTEYREKVSLKAAVIADAQGNWVFASLPKPTVDNNYWGYYFVASTPGERLGWVRGAGELVSVPNAPAAPKEGYVIPAAELGTSEGWVVDKDDTPIAGAAVKMGTLLEIDEKCDPGG